MGQRFSNFVKAMDKLQQSVAYIQHNVIDEEEPDNEEESDLSIFGQIKDTAILEHIQSAGKEFFTA